MKKLASQTKLKKGMLMTLGIFLISVSIANAQYYKKWVVYNKQVNVSIAAPTITALPTTPVNSTVSNGVYNSSGTLLFYVSDNKIYNSSGTSISTFITTITSDQYAVCKVPGASNRYYVIYSPTCPMCNTGLYYSMIQVTGVTATAVAGQQNILFSGAHTYYEYVGFAVRLDYEDSPKYLYACSESGVLDKYNITGAGITFSTNITNSLCCMFSEIDITWNGKRLAVPSYLGNVRVVNLDACGSGNFVSTITYTVPGTPFGVEFNDAGDHLFVSTSSGIYDIDLNLPPTTYSTVTTTSDFTYSFLERAYNGKIYAAKASGLSSFNQAPSYSFTLNAVPFTIVASSFGHYTLPCQNDFLYGIAGANGTYVPCCGTPTIGRIAEPGCTCTYSWAPTTGLTSPTAPQTLAHPGMTTTYTLTRTCGAYITTDQVLVTVGLPCCRAGETDNNDASALENIAIVPNPSSGMFYINGLTNGDVVSLYNNLGKKMNSVAISETNKDISFNLADQAPGIYLVKIDNNNATITKRIVIE